MDPRAAQVDRHAVEQRGVRAAADAVARLEQHVVDAALRSALASVSPAQPAPTMITRSTSPERPPGTVVAPSSYVPVDAPNAVRASGPENAAPTPAAAARRSAPRRVYPPKAPSRRHMLHIRALS